MSSQEPSAVRAAPQGLRLAEEVISREEERELIALIENSGLTYPVYDTGNRRSSTSYGWKYDYRTDRFVPCPSMPQGFERLAQTAAQFAGITTEDLAECLLNRYEPGAVIQPHFDKPVWEHVIGVSLGSPVTMNFRRETDDGEERIDVLLPPRSMYLLAGDARYVFEHGLPPMDETRWSITFRAFSEEGARRQKENAAAI